MRQTAIAPRKYERMFPSPSITSMDSVYKHRLMALPPGPAMACEGGIRMARQFPPGAWMYQVEWQGNGVSLGRLYISATNETDVLAQAEDFFARFPALDFRQECAGTTVNIRRCG